VSVNGLIHSNCSTLRKIVASSSSIDFVVLVEFFRNDRIVVFSVLESLSRMHDSSDNLEKAFATSIRESSSGKIGTPANIVNRLSWVRKDLTLSIINDLLESDVSGVTSSGH